ncbi:MAG TPA: GGDEF domain-containing protein [Burkholderiales bacterium]|nr:GGDEF domain-containing protein [Burkholderiales bacterium]
MEPDSAPGMDWDPFHSFLAGLDSIAVARVARDGRLIEANTAFRGLAGGEACVEGAAVGAAFLAPDFQGLLEACDGGHMFLGPLRIGTSGDQARVLRGAAQLDPNGLRVLAELPGAGHLKTLLAALEVDIKSKEAALARAHREIERQDTVIQGLLPADPLTGLANRRMVEERLEMEVERARRYGTPLSVVMADVDRFGDINQRHGHEAGDAALRVCGRVLKAATRLSDLAARFGGGRFLTVLPHARLAGAAAFSERIRASLSITAVPPLEQAVTASFGVAEYAPGDTRENLVRRAEEAMLKAKEAGRNRVHAAS